MAGVRARETHAADKGPDISAYTVHVGGMLRHELVCKNYIS